MKKSLIISEADNIAALMENDRVVEFFVNRGELLLGDIYVAIVENILPGIDAAFVNLGKDKMGFLHANDIPGEGALRERLVPKQKLLVQITKEPTGHKGPRVSTAISLPGRFLVLVPEERGISISRRISESKERARLKSVVTLMKPPGVGVIIRTEAKGQNEASLFEDFEQLWDRWQTIVSEGEASIGPKLVYRDQDLLYRVIRDAYSTDVTEIICDTADGQRRASDFMSGWAGRTTKVMQHAGDDPLLISKGIDKDIETVLSDRADLPSGGHLNIQPTEALTVIDVNSGRFTSSRTQAETVRKTNIEAAQEIPRQLRLRNIGGMVIVDFIDMESRRDQQQVLEVFNRALEDDRAKPQVGQMSDLGLVELTRRRQGQSLRELFAEPCPHCSGTGAMPTLTLGSGENKRVISLPNKDDDALKGKGSMKGGRSQQGRGQLRAVSATGQRLQPTVQDFEPSESADVVEEEISEVPEDILKQMPEELLDSQKAASDRGSRKNFPLSDEDEGEDEVSQGSSEPSISSSYNNRTPASPQRAPYPAIKSSSSYTADEDDSEDEDEDEEDFVAETTSSISISDLEDEETEDDSDDVENQAEAAVEVQVLEPSITVEATPEPESDFDTEVDPITGIYRLKPKDKIETSDSSESAHEYNNEEHATQLELPFDQYAEMTPEKFLESQQFTESYSEEPNHHNEEHSHGPDNHEHSNELSHHEHTHEHEDAHGSNDSESETESNDQDNEPASYEHS